MAVPIAGAAPRPTSEVTPQSGRARATASAVRLDPAALAAAYAEHAGAIYGIALRMIGDRAAAEDVVQNAFLKLWTATAQFDPARGPVLGLLVTIARHKAIDGMRRVARRRRSEELYCREPEAHDDDPAVTLERAQDARDVRSALLALPYEQRRVIELMYFRDLTCRQIACEIIVPIGTVKSRMRLALSKLGATLGRPASVSPRGRARQE